MHMAKDKLAGFYKFYHMIVTETCRLHPPSFPAKWRYNCFFHERGRNTTKIVIERRLMSLPTCTLKSISPLMFADQIDARNRLAWKRLVFAAVHELTPHLGSVQSMACPLTMAVYRLQMQHDKPSGHAIQWAI